MASLWIPAVCFVACLLLSHTPPSYCAATAPSLTSTTTSTTNPKPQNMGSPVAAASNEGKSQGSRNKRELADSPNLSKRLRTFVGKRSMGSDVISSYLNSLSNEELLHLQSQGFPLDFEHLFLMNLAKRGRSFVGKRDLVEKRPRYFPGKRAGEYDFLTDEPYVQDKRVRSFVGKRPRRFVGKRGRSFVGKRSDDFDGAFSNQVSKDFGQGDSDVFPYIPAREYLGNQAYNDDLDSLEVAGTPISFGEDLGLALDKRPRRFVGKRDMDELMGVQKRLRTFVGKRGRSFVGKRSDFDESLLSDLNKRVRTFVGKRGSSFDDDESPLLSKRLRSFVGKRQSYISKRLRSFVGKR